MVLAEDPPGAPQRLPVALHRVRIPADTAQVGAETHGRAEGVGVFLAQYPAAPLVHVARHLVRLGQAALIAQCVTEFGAQTQHECLVVAEAWQPALEHPLSRPGGRVGVATAPQVADSVTDPLPYLEVVALLGPGGPQVREQGGVTLPVLGLVGVLRIGLAEYGLGLPPHDVLLFAGELVPEHMLDQAMHGQSVRPLVGLCEPIPNDVAVESAHEQRIGEAPVMAFEQFECGAAAEQLPGNGVRPEKRAQFEQNGCGGRACLQPFE